MKKLILIGETGCGKTTLSQYLHNQEQNYHKTQQVHFNDSTIDTPGEFMENPFYYNALVSVAVKAEAVAFVQSIKGAQNYFPPYFATRFPKKAIGIITKMDLLENEQERLQAYKYLKLAGIKTIFEISTLENIGLKELEEFLLS
ncbi:ethanolamine utilization protein EutP [Pilibacter termitis]|uniref:Ethanolamine utilization protein EutP n=1 Tax=Pilibacter termitis TaxID=263852 RepID=A0A1T4ML66_9ENTE|nr:EutP/PduV family microcompartment system protein [Pilibacter termitis]SJZ67621.1 ethanolamine utilization protein EutP [Pilibacter termitis]